MKAELSALMDDALDESEAAATLDRLAREPSLRDDWETYHLIGDSLRSRCHGANRRARSHLLTAEIIRLIGSDRRDSIPPVLNSSRFALVVEYAL